MASTGASSSTDRGHDRRAADPAPGWAGKRVALVGPLPPPAGGMANQTRQLAELLRGEGVAVDVVAVNAAYRPAWVGRVQGVRAVFRLLPYLARLWDASGRAQLVHVMANSGWSWHLFAAPAVWIASLRGVPVVVNYRGGEAARFLARAARLVRPTMQRCAAVVVPSGYLRDVFARHGIAACVVPNVVDLARFKPVARAPGSDAPHVVVARNLEAIYGIDTALQAFAVLAADHPHARLSVAGTGSQAQRLAALARELGLAERVRFTGQLEREAIVALYRDADLMLNPSRVDNSPNSLLEAFASGLPVVTTDVGGIPYLAEDGTSALLVPPERPEAMAAAMKRVIASQPLRERLVAGGLAAVRRHAWPAVRAELFGVYDAAVARDGTLPAVVGQP